MLYKHVNRRCSSSHVDTPIDYWGIHSGVPKNKRVWIICLASLEIETLPVEEVSPEQEEEESWGEGMDEEDEGWKAYSPSPPKVCDFDKSQELVQQEPIDEQEDTLDDLQEELEQVLSSQSSGKPHSFLRTLKTTQKKYTSKNQSVNNFATCFPCSLREYSSSKMVWKVVK